MDFIKELLLGCYRRELLYGKQLLGNTVPQETHYGN